MADFSGDMDAITRKGSSASTINGTVSASKALSAFLHEQNLQDNRWPKNAKELTLEQRQSSAMYERIAHFYANSVELGRKKDSTLELGSAKNYLRDNARTLGAGEDVQISKIVDKLVNYFVLRAIDEGVDCLSSSAPPLYLKQLYKVIEALTRANTSEASFRALVLVLTYDAVGRGGEVGALCWPLVRWAYDIDNGLFTWCKRKTGKQYPVPLLPHRDNPDGDAYYQMSNAAAHGQFNRVGPARNGEALPLFSQFSDLKGNATKVSNMLKDLATGTSKFVKVGILEGNEDLAATASRMAPHLRCPQKVSLR